MSKFCFNCGKEIMEGEAFCKNCGASLNNATNNQNTNIQNVNNNNQTSNQTKDNAVIGFVCSLVGFLCCTYVAIPGLIYSIMAYNDIKNGKIKSDKKWMAILGIILGALGIITLFMNLINPNQEIVELVEEWLG